MPCSFPGITHVSDKILRCCSMLQSDEIQTLDRVLISDIVSYGLLHVDKQ